MNDTAKLLAHAIQIIDGKHQPSPQEPHHLPPGFVHGKLYVSGLRTVGEDRGGIYLRTAWAEDSLLDLAQECKGWETLKANIILEYRQDEQEREFEARHRGD